MVRRRCAGFRLCVKWMKKGTTPIGLTIARSAISGFIRSMPDATSARSAATHKVLRVSL